MKRLLIILPLLFWIACDEDAEDNLTAELVGTWYLSRAHNPMGGLFFCKFFQVINF